VNIHSHTSVTSDRRDGALLRRIRAEYQEMPGLRLTLWQASRLWGVDQDTCARVVASLTEEGFLTRTADGAYASRLDASR
jgi:DNA-binding IclR family transcriptional regulator